MRGLLQYVVALLVVCGSLQALCASHDFCIAEPEPVRVSTRAEFRAAVMDTARETASLATVQLRHLSAMDRDIMLEALGAPLLRTRAAAMQALASVGDSLSRSALLAVVADSTRPSEEVAEAERLLSAMDQSAPTAQILVPDIVRGVIYRFLLDDVSTIHIAKCGDGHVAHAFDENAHREICDLLQDGKWDFGEWPEARHCLVFQLKDGSSQALGWIAERSYWERADEVEGRAPYIESRELAAFILGE